MRVPIYSVCCTFVPVFATGVYKDGGHVVRGVELSGTPGAERLSGRGQKVGRGECAVISTCVCGCEVAIGDRADSGWGGIPSPPVVNGCDPDN